MEQELKKYLSVIGFEKISITKFYNGFIRKPKGCTKQQVTKSLKEICLKMGYNLVKPESLGKRVYVFEKRINKIYEEVSMHMLLELQPNEYLTLKSSENNKEIKKLIKKSKYVTNNRFKIKISEDGITRIFRTV